ncbi:Disintegrin and metalloproteinase domain-containing protein 8 [Merluccius polli]|uniref:Disintegrin and metalloproteinase domain-containing protein 8 n=1 Tax=Merluccius polli TaxID=89951 RepID=A0AA47P841_MERPO|nr:Disintegrin and metalloproteinase domain-containing protein 8 [Merluccius polli]
MQYLDYLICLCIFFGGTCVDTQKTLPHVIEYQTITPQKLGQTSTEQQKNPHIVTYSLAIAGKNRTLHLERNIDLIGRNFSVVHYSEQGTEETAIPDHQDHCYYHGHIVEVEDSSASIELCSGIKGHVRIEDQSYLIEPLAEESETDQHDGTEVEEGLHAVYNYKHLRQKRSSCPHGGKDIYLDHGSQPYGMFQLSKQKTLRYKKIQNGKTRTVELVLVVDNTEYNKIGSWNAVKARMLEVVNHVDKLYRAVGLRVMLVGLEMWNYRDQMEVSLDPGVTLERFKEWRQKTLLSRIKHDNAQFITGVNFNGDTVGLAFTSSMCTGSSGAVNEDHNPNAIGVATTLTHEMGHNLGLSHDGQNCICRSSQSQGGCIMAPSHGSVYSQVFSSCSLEQLTTFLEEVNPACLLDTPSTDRIFGGPVCGNAFVEYGEECDCGTVEECKNPCCNATTCKLKADAKCADGECCHNCQLKETGTMCRPLAGECDLAEYCTGFSASCPTDAYTQNGRPCNRGSGYCLNGGCPSQEQHCKRLWGPGGTHQQSLLLNPMCGKQLCSKGWEFPVTSQKSSHTLTNGEQCNVASVKQGDNFPPDIVMIPTGTKCGGNMVCYNQRCQNMKNIEEVYGTEDCSDKCNNRGVCNHERQCHCDPGWAAPYCDVKLSEGSTVDIAVVIGVSLAMLILLVVGIVGGLLWRKKGSTKRPRITSMGESNPMFQSSSVQGSPRVWPPQIGQPKFVESTASQVCKPVTGKILPSREAPRPAARAALKPPTQLR